MLGRNRHFLGFLALVLLGVFFCPLHASAAVASYEELRSRAGSPGETITLTAEQISGVFHFSTTDLTGLGDDNGITLRAPNGWWIRQFTATIDTPIALDWFQPSENQNITGLLTHLSSIYRPTLYLKAPSISLTLLSDYIDFGARGVTRFAFLESEAAVKIKLTGNGGTMWHLDTVSELVIGSIVKKNSPADYHLTLEGTWAWDNRSTTEIESIVEAYNVNSTAEEFYLRFNTRNAKAHGIRISGVRPPATTYIAGLHENSAMYTGLQGTKIVFEDAYFSDPLAYAYGWKGGLDGGSALLQTEEPRSNPRARQVVVVNSEAVLGSLTLQYGGEQFLGFFVKKFGTGPAEPLVVTYKDLGYSGPNNLGYPAGVALGDAWYMRIAGKFDGLGLVQPDLRFLKFIFENQYGPYNQPYGFFLEASQLDDNPNGTGTQDSYTTFTTVNAAGTMGGLAAGAHPEDDIHHMTWQGDGVHPAQVSGTLLISHSDTVRDGQFHDLRLMKLENGKGGINNRVEKVAFTGAVTVDPAVVHTSIENSTWLGDARTVMLVGSGADVTLQSVAPPRFSMIEGSGTVVLDGVRVSLPYVFGGWRSGAVPAAPFTADADTVALFHLDSSLQDNGPKNLSSGMLMHGSAAYLPGKFDSALNLDGTNHVQSLYSGVTSLKIPPGDITLEAWISPGVQNKDAADIVRWNNDSHDYLALQTYQGKRLRLQAIFSGQNRYSISSDLSQLLWDGNWHHVKGIVDRASGGTLRLYLDERKLPFIRHEAAAPVNPAQTKGFISIGGWTDSQTVTNYVGLIDEVRISTSAVYPAHEPEAPRNLKIREN
jgi:hypothetical protein